MRETDNGSQRENDVKCTVDITYYDINKHTLKNCEDL